MSLKKWFSRLFKSTRNEELIAELKDEISLLKDFSEKRASELHSLQDIFKSQREHVSNLNSIYINRIEALEKKLSIIGTQELEDLKHRIGKNELMHVATSKRQNDLFEDGTRNLMKLSSQICIHAMTLAHDKIKEVTAALDLPESREYHIITINGQIKTVYTEGLTYNEIVTLAFNFAPRGDEKYSITYTGGGDGIKPSGTISEKDTLLVKAGTAVNIVVVEAGGS